MFKEFRKHIGIMRKISKGNAYVIYQMGKVGSSSIEKSLEKSKLNVIHVHTLYGLTENYKFSKKRNKLNEFKKYILSLLYRFVLKRSGQVKIITLIREPVSRNVSTLFQELPKMLYIDSKNDNRKELDANSTLNNFLDLYVNQEIPLTWFNDELESVTGINVFETKFDKTAGYSFYKNKNFEVLLLTAERLNKNKSVIESFTNTSIDLSKGANISKNKWYSGLYSDFKNNFKPNELYMNKFYSDKRIKHFYLDDEIDDFRGKWS